jgi:hypothetical protein
VFPSLQKHNTITLADTNSCHKGLYVFLSLLYKIIRHFACDFFVPFWLFCHNFQRICDWETENSQTSATYNRQTGPSVIQIFLVSPLAFLLLLVSRAVLGASTPVVGILTQPWPNDKTIPPEYYYIAGSYVKFLEVRGSCH